MIAEVGLIARQTDLPVTADLEAGYGDPGGTVSRAIDVGIVGANLEDQCKPLDQSVRAVEAAVKAGEQAGIPFALNARTDAFLKAGDRDPEEVIIDFALNPNPFHAGRQEVQVTQRLIMNFYTAKRLLSALGMTLQRHEATFGNVELDVNRRAHPQGGGHR